MTEQPILIGTRTGKKVHRGFAGSSVTLCGHWQKTQNSRYALDLREEDLADRLLCEHCFPNGLAGQPVAPPEHTPTTIRQVEDVMALADYTERTDLLGQQARFQAAQLFRTMNTPKLFTYLSVTMPPRLAAIYSKAMKEAS